MPVPVFLWRFPSQETEGGFLIPCPDRHASSGFSVTVRLDERLRRWRLQCVDARNGEVCGVEADLIQMLGISDSEIQLVANPDGQVMDGPLFVDLREIEERDVEWIDRPFLPAGELVTNDADGDVGKGLLSVHWGSRTSRGEFGDRRMVVFAVAEDAYDTVLKPRLLAADANFEYVRALGWRRAGIDDALLIPDDIPRLEVAIAEMKVRLLVIDPLLSHLSGQVKSHVDHEVKIALRPLMELAHRTGCAILGNGHLTKDRSGGARRASSGSTAFTNTPRVGLAMAYDDEDTDLRVLEVMKSNLGPKGIGRNYRVKTIAVPGLEDPVPILVAEGAAMKAVDDLIAEQDTSADVAAWRAEYDDGQRYRLTSAMRQALAAAVRWKYLDRNPAVNAGRNPQPRAEEIFPFSPDEVGMIAAELDAHDAGLRGRRRRDRPAARGVDRLGTPRHRPAGAGAAGAAEVREGRDAPLREEPPCPPAGAAHRCRVRGDRAAPAPA
jgi:hypothetical protein